MNVGKIKKVIPSPRHEIRGFPEKIGPANIEERVVEIDEIVDDDKKQFELIYKLLKEQDEKRSKPKTFKTFKHVEETENKAMQKSPSNLDELDTVPIIFKRSYCMSVLFVFFLTRLFFNYDSFSSFIFICSGFYLLFLAQAEIWPECMEVLLNSSLADLVAKIKEYYITNRIINGQFRRKKPRNVARYLKEKFETLTDEIENAFCVKKLEHRYKAKSRTKLQKTSVRNEQLTRFPKTSLKCNQTISKLMNYSIVSSPSLNKRTTSEIIKKQKRYEVPVQFKYERRLREEGEFQTYYKNQKAAEVKNRFVARRTRDRDRYRFRKKRKKKKKKVNPLKQDIKPLPLLAILRNLTNDGFIAKLSGLD